MRLTTVMKTILAIAFVFAFYFICFYGWEQLCIINGRFEIMLIVAVFLVPVAVSMFTWFGTFLSFVLVILQRTGTYMFGFSLLFALIGAPFGGYFLYDKLFNRHIYSVRELLLLPGFDSDIRKVMTARERHYFYFQIAKASTKTELLQAIRDYIAKHQSTKDGNTENDYEIPLLKNILAGLDQTDDATFKAKLNDIKKNITE